MKKRGLLLKLSGIFFVLLLTLFLTIPNVMAVQYLGEVSFKILMDWDNTDNIDPPEESIAKIAITYLGDNNYQIIAKVELTTDFVTSGGGFIKNNIFFITLHKADPTDNGTDLQTGIMNFRIDLDSEKWEGTWWSVDTDAELGDFPFELRFEHDYSAGRLELVDPNDKISLDPGPGPGNGEEVCACYKKENGQLRIVDDFSKCVPPEIPIYLKVKRVN